MNKNRIPSRPLLAPSQRLGAKQRHRFFVGMSRCLSAFSLIAFFAIAALATTSSVFAIQEQAESPPTGEDGYKSIFDGKTLDGWQGDAKLWRVEGGAIVGETTDENQLKRNKFIYWSQGDVDDFSLRLKFKISGTDRANSGVQVRSEVDAEGHMAGYQADIERGGKYCGILYSEKTGRGILCQRGQKVVHRTGKDRDVEQVADAEMLFKKINIDDWNEMEVVAEGNRIVVKINGNVTADFTDEEKEKFVASGKIGLQLHVGPPMKIEFKDIRLKRLKLKEDQKKVVFVAGKKSHGWGSHEHNAGCLLLAKCLREASSKQPLKLLTTVYRDGWPSDPTAFDNADTIVVYCDGGGNHFLHRNGDAFEEVMARGVGLVCIHYGVEVPKGPSGQRFLSWIGGYFETNWSVNPVWTAKFESIPEHDVTRGVKSFELHDEWYYHMRFVDQMTRVTPLLSTLPPAESLSRKDGPHSNNPSVREAVLEKKQPQHMAWTFERGDGGRGFGFTGGHFHKSWAEDNFRTLVLNAIAWTAHVEVPKDGIASATPTEEELDANQDYPKPTENAKK